MNYTLIASGSELAEFRRLLYEKRINTIGMDFEAEYNLHEYGERLCLVQVNAAGRLFIIDPFGIDGSEIKKTLELPKVVKIFFDASSDAALVRRQYDAQLGPVLDLKIIADALGVKSGGFGLILKSYLGIETKKKSKFQTYNWTRRPISDEAMSYALDDVRYLIELKDRLLAEVHGSTQIERLVVAHLQQCLPRNHPGSRQLRLQNVLSGLSPVQRRSYDVVDRIRDGFAKIVNKPKSQIIENHDVLRIAKGQMSPSDCSRTKVLSLEQQRLLLETLQKELGRVGR